MKVKFAGEIYEVVDKVYLGGVIFYGIKDEPEDNPEHIDCVHNVEIIKED